MLGWHHRLDGHVFDQVLGVSDVQRCLACCSPCGHKESDTTKRLNWSDLGVLCSVPLVYISIFMSVPYCFDYCNFVMCFEIKRCYASSFFLFFYSRLLWLFKAFCGSAWILEFFFYFCSKHYHWNFDRICRLLWLVWTF